jgi:hypothetical protein
MHSLAWNWWTLVYCLQFCGCSSDEGCLAHNETGIVKELWKAHYEFRHFTIGSIHFLETNKAVDSPSCHLDHGDRIYCRKLAARLADCRGDMTPCHQVNGQHIYHLYKECLSYCEVLHMPSKIQIKFRSNIDFFGRILSTSTIECHRSIFCHDGILRNHPIWC